MTDAFNLADAQIVNAPDVTYWPVTTAITQVQIVPGGTAGETRVTFSKKDGPGRWPIDYIPPTFEGPIQYTLWLFLLIAGRWTGSGFIQFWYGLEGSGGSVSNYLPNWYYGNAWAPMSGHVIQPGELIGFMVTAGSARAGSVGTAVSERSNIVLIPATDSGTFLFSDAATPAPPGPTAPPPSAPPPGDVADCHTRLTAIEQTLLNIVAKLNEPHPTLHGTLGGKVGNFKVNGTVDLAP